MHDKGKKICEFMIIFLNVILFIQRRAFDVLVGEKIF